MYDVRILSYDGRCVVDVVGGCEFEAGEVASTMYEDEICTMARGPRTMADGCCIMCVAD